MNNKIEHIYEKISIKVHEFMYTVAEYFNLPLESLRHFHYQQYCIEVYDFEIHKLSMGRISQKKFWANITIVDNSAIICYNGNSTNIGRINYSIAHEINHFILGHYLDGTQFFAELVDKSSYTQQDIPKELEANIGASLLMANDDALEYHINLSMNFKSLCHEFQMSYAALRMRLVNFLTFNYGFSSLQAWHTVKNFEVDNIDLKKILSNCHLNMYA
ncbi:MULTISPECIES: ImmA/IrrE family metallo-endopeptidase [unclassified Granulicatella]|uniref:ImmA/IrrE family metallo-endopeptidase n=1 Tax=unclassified Granulicatella TaxID=2630493 RepID=UPI001073C104|nr:MULTISPECIES: ImmA/IrrE family metallo-endopeptidase [unclassified Granulicatella]MBF0779787.1 ImmA/IrrE family metallo-endopeptidase [Granulicatella sp. 19428wC4_WM01]TFU96189.1 ImmA/IrrE family metallo-endopeptidase [Granulicatella sp. WM01]